MASFRGFIGNGATPPYRFFLNANLFNAEDLENEEGFDLATSSRSSSSSSTAAQPLLRSVSQNDSSHFSM
jgi:hypothetical protein